MNKKRINIIILFIALGLVLYFTLKDDLNGIMFEISQTKLLIFALAMVVLVLSQAIKTFGLHTFLKECDPKYKWKDTFKLTLIAQFLNGITPFQTGGQPFEVYLLKKQGIRISDSTGALIKDFIAYQISLIVTGILALIINLCLNIIKINSGINWLIFIGFVVNFIVLGVLLMIISPKERNRNIIRKIIRKNGPLHEVGIELVSEELRETGVYNTILTALSEGKHKLNELYEHTEFSRAKIEVFLILSAHLHFSPLSNPQPQSQGS